MQASAAAETVALYNALETLTFGGADDVDKIILGEEVNSNGIAEFVLAVETLELGQVALGGHAGFLEVTEFGLGAVLLLLLLKSELEGIVAIGLNGFHLANHTRTYFDNSARKVLSVGTENGCHSDFLS